MVLNMNQILWVPCTTALYKLFQDNTSKMIYDWLMNYNVSVNIFLKDHRIMSYCTTESVDADIFVIQNSKHSS
jgi:hypothetical protein